MASISTAELKINQPVEVAAPDATLTITIDRRNPLPIGTHVFQLQVVDDSGNKSNLDQRPVVILDSQAPTAVLRAPKSVAYGQEIVLSGEESSDAGGGKIVKYIFTLLQ